MTAGRLCALLLFTSFVNCMKRDMTKVIWTQLQGLSRILVADILFISVKLFVRKPRSENREVYLSQHKVRLYNCVLKVACADEELGIIVQGDKI